MNYWIIKARPDRNDFSEFPARGRDGRWYTARLPKEWSIGDFLFIWAAAPLLRIIGLAELVIPNDGRTRGLHYFRVRYTSNLFEGPTINELRKNSIFRNAPFLKQGPSGTVFSLTEQQGLTLRAMTDAFFRQIQQTRTTNSDEIVARQIIGAGFGTPEENRKVEKAAIRVATSHLAEDDWLVKSVESKKIGYDLHCIKNGSTLRVEVKGIRGNVPKFVLTVGEYKRALTDPLYALCIVTSALRKPHVFLIQQHNLLDHLHIAPLTFKAEIAKKSITKKALEGRSK